MNRSALSPAGWATALFLLLAGPAAAQMPMRLNVNAVFYGDDTEFSNPFRAGETTVGALQRIVVELEPSDRATLQLGVYAAERAGSHSAVDHTLPIVSLRLRSPHQQVILGTLSTDRQNGFGPDRTTPHGLLPPLGRESLWFARAYEAGVQWLARTDRVEHDMWFDYQKLNTPDHREQFESGAVGRFKASGPLSVGYHVHLVHHGGEQYASGPVSDSLGYGPGVFVQGALGRLESVSVEVFGLVGHDRPDRAVARRTRTGAGLFVRAAAEKQLWRGHLIVWHARDFVHEDGDPNYLSKYSNGARYVGARDYGELGGTRLFRPAPGLEVEASARLHRVERYYGYSARLLAIVHLTAWRTGS